MFKKFKKPSQVTRSDSAIICGNDLISHWTTKVDEDKINSAINILEAFGLDRIYDAAPKPKVKADNIFSLFR